MEYIEASVKHFKKDEQLCKKMPLKDKNITWMHFTGVLSFVLSLRAYRIDNSKKIRS